MTIPIRPFLGAFLFASGVCVAAVSLAADDHKSAADHGAPSKTASKPEAKADSKAEAKVESKSDYKSIAKSDAKGEGKGDPKLEQKMEIKWSKKPEPKEEPRVEPRAEPRYPRRVTTESAERESGAYRTASMSGARSRTPVASSITAETRRVALSTVAARSGDISKAGDAHGAEAVPHAAHPPHWSYEGPNGPQAWAKLAPEFAKCGVGERQSPIDIRDGLKVDLEPITFEYRPSSFKVVDNGHTIQANVNGWNSIRLQGRVFRLVQFHFHTPSEEMIDGKQFDMVAHLVHQDSQGKLAVVAVLIEKGARQPVLQTVLNNLPLEKNEPVTVNSSSLDLSQLLPDTRRYFTYMGSLTTPPCTEDVLWIVMKQPVQATAEQLNLFSRMYPMNARPIQANAGRVIKESN
jgi:carbonic anhydrase